MTRAILTIVLAAVPLLAAEKAAAPPPPIEYGPPKLLCSLANRDVDESSGVACGHATPGVFWTHNDSGDSPRIFAFNAKGEDLGTFDIQAAIHRDWEDIASFTRGGKAYLLIADIGDNDAERDDYTLYLAEEPRLNPEKRSPRAKLRVRMAIAFRYEDGSQNCEAIAVDPTSGLILLATKTVVGKAGVYGLRIPERVVPDQVLVAKLLAPLKLTMVTAMDVSPDGLRSIVLTYGNAYEFTRAPDEKWSDAFARVPRMISMPPRRQGESICYGPDGKTLYLTGEKLPCPLFEVPVVEKK